MGGSYQQEVDLLSLFKDVSSEYAQMVTVPEQLPNVLDRAIRIATARRVPTTLVIPADVQELEYSPPQHAFKMVPSSIGVEWPDLAPDGDALRRAADVLDAGRKVAILVGAGARGAAAEIEQVADLLGAGVAKALLGKDVVSDDPAWVTGAIGLLGTRPSYEMMMGCDTLLTIGSSFPYTQFMPEFGQARAVQIDIDPGLIGMRYPYEVNLVGDAATTLRALIPLLQRESDRSWRESIESDVTRWWETMAMRAAVDADPINPMRLFAELSDRLPDDAIVTADSGSAANWYARHLRFRGNMRGSLSGNLATMGPGVPYAIGAKIGHPDRPVIAFAGDGAMQMNGMAELITVQRYWRDWVDPRLVVAVLHNNDLNQVTWEMRAMGGAPKFTESQQLPDVDYAGFAAGLGLAACAVDKPEQVAPAWEQALAADRPTVLDVRCDPNVPPIPPHASVEQIKDTALSLARGDEDRWEVLKQGARTKLQEFLPHREG
jgi:pyruvate dehydrogenase (quinone)